VGTDEGRRTAWQAETEQEDDDDDDDSSMMELVSLLKNTDHLHDRANNVAMTTTTTTRIRNGKSFIVGVMFSILAITVGCVLTIPRWLIVRQSNNNNSSSSRSNNNNLFAFSKTKSSSKTSSECDCYDSTSSRCCDRTIWRTHKFGTILIGDVFSEYRSADSPFHVHTQPTPKNSDYELPTTLDYRHVMVTRNWYDAIVSGYLYHRAGYECTIDYKGNVSGHIQHHSKWFNLEQHYHLIDWDVQLTYRDRYDIPNRHNRSFCTYLQEESEEDGMVMITDFALSRWYKGVVSYHRKVQERRRQDHVNKTLFLCFEDFVDPFQQEDIFYQIMDFLFPGYNDGSDNRTTTVWKMPGEIKASLEEQRQSQKVYDGSHASDHDPTLRERLRRLVQQYDERFFDRTVATSSAIFGCGDGSR
jgi:hypothetical protein